MKKALKTILIIVGILFIIFIGFLTFIFSMNQSIKLDENKLINPNKTINFYDSNNNLIVEESKGVSITKIENIPKHTINAFISIEDKRFYQHNGVDYRGLIRASLNNLKSFSFKEGASTISQQLIKNTHLTNEKTIKRKITEIKLAKKLEKNYTKDEILEKYLNTIYFGDDCYGITSASLHYFNKSPSKLNVNESAVLAGIVKAPSHYSPFVDIEKCTYRRNLVLREMYNQNYITKMEYDENINTSIKTNITNCEKEYDYLYLAKKEYAALKTFSPYQKQDNIYLSLNQDYQKIVKKSILDFNNIDCEKSAVLMDINGNILAYYSTCGDINRQLGSIIKPIAVYSPAIENNVVNSYTILNDVKTDFNGYSPSNYNDIYRGNITVKDSLAYSSNVCAVKLLNYVGIENACKILSKMDFNINDGDKALTLALGASENGEKLTTITSAYSIFANKGNYKRANCIKTIKNGALSLPNPKKKEKIINEDTAYIICDMLKNNVQNGTAKKLSYCKNTLYAKTGTVGNKNGNTDAYVISFDSKLILGVWCGNKDKTLLNNSISGGTTPSLIAKNIWNDINDLTLNLNEIEKPSSIIETYIDKISLENENIVVLADKNTPERYKIKAIFKESSLPKNTSTRFSKPTIDNYKISVNNNLLCIRLCHTQYCEAKIYKLKNKDKELVYDSKKDKKDVYIENLIENQTYSYSIIPYYEINGEVFYGDEIILDTIKTPSELLGDNWWIDTN